MLAGYLPFDDDPANPEGDNINLLYKYIVSTTLTFPEYVTPHARDLLRRILVPDPRKRADLFEVARHSWLSEYSHVVGFITSSATSTNDIANTTIPAGRPLAICTEGRVVNELAEDLDIGHLQRSASVREPSKSHGAAVSSVGGLTQKHGNIDQNNVNDKKNPQRETKRRTVQVEYVAPQSSTTRGEPSSQATTSPTTQETGGRTRARAGSTGPVEVPPQGYGQPSSRTAQRPSSSDRQNMPPPSRPGREAPRSVSDSTAFNFAQSPPTTSARPSTGGTIGSQSRLPSRGNSYGQPAAATVAQTNAQGRFSQPPKGSRGQYVISTPLPQQEHAIGEPSPSRPSARRVPSHPQQQDEAATSGGRSSGHKRTSTSGSITEKIFGRFGSISGRSSEKEGTPSRPAKRDRAYPPTSMSNAMPNDNGVGRKSTESSRRTSFGFSRKNSDEPNARSARRFSFLPSSLSGSRFGSSAGKDPSGEGSINDRRNSTAQSQRSRPVSRPQMAFGRGESRSRSQSTIDGIANNDTGYQDQRARAANVPLRTPQTAQPSFGESHPAQQPGYGVSKAQQILGDSAGALAHPSQQHAHSNFNTYSYTSNPQPNSAPPMSTSMSGGLYAQSPTNPNQLEPGYDPAMTGEDRLGMKQMGKNRRFADAYEDGAGHQQAGSSGAARKVMDFFRRTGKGREGRR
jgi:protein-serine/threonine kinase